MNKALSLFALIAVFPLGGCGPSEDGKSATPDGPPGLSADLKNDAFEYYGLGGTKPVRLEVTNGEGSIPQIGTRTYTVGKIEGDKATFVQHQDGALAAEGDITLSLEKDGLYVMSSTKSGLKPHTLELPAKLEVGGGWKDHTEMSNADSQKIVLDNDLKIERKERIQTKGGTFDDALYITSTGKGVIGAQPVTLTTKHWYVRGMGPVKQIVEVESKGQPKRTITIELAAPEPANAKTTGGATPPAETKK